VPCPQALSESRWTRRGALQGLLVVALESQPCLAANDNANDVTRLLRAGGCSVLLRHAATQPGVGDPPEFSLDDCRTQRNLSVAGQQDARRIGLWFGSRKLVPRAVLCSAWCRCKDTAQLAFGKHDVWAALNSTFGDRLQQPDQTTLLRQALARIPVRRFEVWVTHQVNISALTGQGPAMGEALILDREGKLLARSTFE
jgi:phosphohistidine phosphatase SixA